MRLGRSSLVVSLPKNWLNLVKLEHGDTVSVEIEKDGSLKIFPKKEEISPLKEITILINPKEDQSSINRTIIAYYLNGYTDIKLVSEKIFSTSQQMAIRRIARKLYIRIIESDTKQVHMTILDDESKVPIISYIQRMYMISNSMLKDVFTAFMNKDSNIARSIYSLDDDVDHFSFFILRLLRRASIDPSLAKKLGVNSIDCQDYKILAYRIEHVADHAAYIARQIITLNAKKLAIPDELIKLIYLAGTRALEMYDQSFNAFFSKDIDLANKVIEEQKNIENLINEIASKSFVTSGMNAMTICATCSIRDIITRIADWSVAIAESSILRAYSDL